MKRMIIIVCIGVVLMVAYFVGPRFPKPFMSDILPTMPVKIDSLETYIQQRESLLPVKPDNQSMILWGDSIGKKTEYVLLYLHGFSASRYEGFPVTHDFVKEFKVNAYLPRLAEHGLETEEALLNMTPERLYASAREALVIAQGLGEKVIIMGTSTGGTLALMLAAHFPDRIAGLILYSPNIRIKNSFSPLLSGPWGLQIARLVNGGKYSEGNDAPGSKMYQYWYNKYRLEAVVYLQQLLDERMTPEVFAKVKVPVFLGYYYKDKKHQDQTVNIKAALRMFDELGTPGKQKIKIAFPEAGNHVIACELTSGSVEEVKFQTFTFAREILGLK